MPVKDLIFTVLGIDRASHVFDGIGKSMDRMSRTGTKSMAAMLGASLGASAGIGAALGGLSVLFAATAAAALSQNNEVASSFRDLGLSVKDGLVADSAILQDEMVGAADSINDAFQDLRPQLRQAFAASQPHVEKLVDGVTGFAREAMPGMVTAVRSAGPVMDGLKSLLISSGQATSDFFTIISQGAPGAGHALESLGELVEGVLPDVGQMLVNLTELWTEHGDQTVRVITNITDVVSDLSSSALPTMSDGIGVALDVLEGLLAVIKPMSGVLGPLIGMWLSLSLALKGLGAVRGIVDSVGTSVSGMRDKFDKSPGAVGKLTKAVGGAMGLLGGPWGLAVAGATAVLALFGQESQENAEDQRTLAGALKESGGTFDQHARKVLSESAAFQEVAASIETAGISQSDFMDAVINGGNSLSDMEKQLRAIIDAGTETTNSNRGQITSWTDQALAAKDALAGLKGMREMVVAATEDFRRQAEAVAGVGSSMASARPGADSLAEAIGVLGDKTADTAARADAFNNAWMRLLGIGVTMEQATAGFEGALDTIGSTMERVKEETENWRNVLVGADGQVDLSTEANRQLSAGLIAAGEDYRTLAQTAYDTTLQRTGSEWLATTEAVKAAGQRRAQFISEMQQMGFNADQALALANRYLGLPDDVLTLLRADSSNAQGVVDRFVNTNDGRTITIFVRAFTGAAQNAIAAVAQAAAVVSGGRATGGPVEAGRIYRVGEHGEELFMAPADGTIVPNGPTRRFLAGLRAGAGARARSSAYAETVNPMAGRQGASLSGGDDERVIRLLTKALERVTVNMDGRAVGIMQGRQAGLLGRTG